ncbi:hypothetical protein BH11MYX3_BH11MYX3_04380 [soil metagenome]
MSRTTFYGFGAYVGSIRGLTECAWWDDDPVRVHAFSQAALVPVDLSKNLTAARAGTIPYADMQCDDHAQDKGLTTIGPMFPGGAVIGACWLTEDYYGRLSNKPPRQPASAPDDAHDYELTSYQYYGGEQGDRRFYGFHARIIGTNGPLTNVEIWDAGTGKIANRAPAGTWWLDLARVALPAAEGTNVAANAPGALFLDAATAKSLGLRGPKRPPDQGTADLP